MSGSLRGRPQLGADDARTVLSTSPKDIDLPLLRSWMAATAGAPARYDARSLIVVPDDMRQQWKAPAGEGEYGVRHCSNWGSVEVTTVGRVVANGLIFSRSAALRAILPFLNVPWNDKVVDSIQQAVVDARLDGKIDADDAIWTIDRLQWLGYAPTSFLTPSMTADTIRLPKATQALKTQILAGPRGDAARANDLKEVGAIEADLLASARKELEGSDPGMEIYDSGARGNFGNNYKNTAVMRGAILRSDDPSIIHVSTASLADGIPAAEVPNYADIIVRASYGRAMKTAEGGYIMKQLNAAFQGLGLDPDPESNCGTKLTLQVRLDNPRDYLYRFFVGERGGLTEITPAVAPGLAGKTVGVRSPMFCGSQHGICSRCAGTLHYRMGILQIGLLAGRIGTTMMNSALKAFHDTSLKLTRVKLQNYVRPLPPPGSGRAEE